MDFKDVLVDAQGSAVAAYTKFLYQYYHYDNVIACFIEGQDYCYYENKINSIVPDDYEVLFYPCNGRDEVEKVSEIITKNCKFKRNVKMMYFADKDYDLKERKEHVYYTDYYSVENFYCQKEFIAKVLKSFFNISRYDSDYQICMNLFNEKYKIYYEEITKVNGFAYAIRAKEKSRHLKRTNLSKIKFENMIENKNFDSFKMKSFDYISLKKKIDLEFEITENEFKESILKIDKSNLRGKWELQFYIWFLNGLKKCINNGTYNLMKNEKIKISFDNLMSITATQAIFTKELKEYINRVLT